MIWSGAQDALYFSIFSISTHFLSKYVCVVSEQTGMNNYRCGYEQRSMSRNQRLSFPLTDSVTLWSHECLSLALGTNRRRRDCLSAEIRMEDVGFDVQSCFEVNPCGQLHDREMLHCKRRFDSTFWPKARVVVFACFPLPGAHCTSGTPQVWDGWSRNISCVEKRCVFLGSAHLCQ